jgi:hypothetical protein
MLDSIISGDADSFFRKQRVPVKRLFRGEFAKHIKSYIENVLPSQDVIRAIPITQGNASGLLLLPLRSVRGSD